MEQTITRASVNHFSDIYAHLIKHGPLMEPDRLKKEIITVIHNLYSNNTVPDALKGYIQQRLKNVINNDTSPAIVRKLCEFALWLDKLEPTETGYTFPALAGEDDPEVAKKPQEIIDDLHYFFGVDYFDIEITLKSCKIYVGPNRRSHPYAIARHLATLQQERTKIYAYDKIIGKINWLSVKRNEIAIAHATITNAGTVYESIASVFSFTE